VKKLVERSATNLEKDGIANGLIFNQRKCGRSIF